MPVRSHALRCEQLFLFMAQSKVLRLPLGLKSFSKHHPLVTEQESLGSTISMSYLSLSITPF